MIPWEFEFETSSLQVKAIFPLGSRSRWPKVMALVPQKEGKISG